MILQWIERKSLTKALVCVSGAVFAAGAHSQIDLPRVVPGTRSATAFVNTLYGPTGLIVVPSAYTARERTIQLGTAFGKHVRGATANYGIVPYVEVGGSVLEISRSPIETKVFGNAKVTIVPSNFRHFEVGIGVIDAANAFDDTIYFVASADLETPDVTNAVGLRMHLGAGTGVFRERVIGGAELRFVDRYSVIGEWDARDFNAGVRYTHDQTFSVQAGVQADRLFFGTSYVMRF